MPLRKKIPIYNPFITPWKPGEVYVYQVKNPPIDEAYNPPKDYKNYIGWYITLYVHEILDDFNLPGMPDRIPCIYGMFSEKKPTSISDLNKLTLLFDYTFLKDNIKVKDYRWRLAETSLKKYPKELEYLGQCKDFKYPSDEYIDPIYTSAVWWNTIEISAIRKYELILRSQSENDK